MLGALATALGMAALTVASEVRAQECAPDLEGRRSILNATLRVATLPVGPTLGYTDKPDTSWVTVGTGGSTSFSEVRSGTEYAFEARAKVV